MTYCLQNSHYRFLLTVDQIEVIANNFRQAMIDGLQGAGSPLKMLPSFLHIPCGQIEGTFAAVDFGGSHVRALEADLADGHASVRLCRKIQLPQAKDADELFDAVARLVQEVVSSSDYLGHTFSFPCHQENVNKARLISWTKEMATPGVEGEDINLLLERALKNLGMKLRPAAILNDTVGTLLAAVYSHPLVDIAAICGTGHNTCYVEPVSPVSGKPMIINMESGNFNKLPYTYFDDLLDAESDRPGQQRLEKMVAGRYLGELARLIILELSRASLLPADIQVLQVPYSLSAEDIAGWITRGGLNSWLRDKALQSWNDVQCSQVKAICRELFLRSAQLAAATFLGVLHHIDPGLTRYHVIAVDGSLYEKAPGYAEQVDLVIKQALGVKYTHVEIKLVKDGSGIGAAIAAAIASKGVD